MANRKIKLVIDVDTGVDDAQAIMMALTSPGVDVLGITCVSGNTNVDQACINTLRVLRAFDHLSSVPVYRGAPYSLVGTTVDATFHHGSDGLGDVEDPHKTDLSGVQPKSASQAIVDIVNENQGEVTLVALGPLTNIAMAIQLDRELGSKLKSAVIMGGNTEGHGNIWTCAEFNFYKDPEAANFVLDHLKCKNPTKLMCWERCQANNLSFEWFAKQTEIDSERGKFHNAIQEHTFKRKKARGYTTYFSCDPLAMLVALDGSVVEESEKEYCTVELAGKYTRGMLVIDRNKYLQRSPNVELIMRVDMNKFKFYFERMLQ